MTNYGLKVNSKYNLADYEEKIMTTSGDVILFESGIYKIYCDGDVYVSHNIFDGLIHVNLISIKDNISINVNAIGEVNKNMCADILHTVTCNNKNVEVNINVKGVASDESKIIYRSKIKAEVKRELQTGLNDGHSVSGAGTQKAKFLKMSDECEVDAEPALEIEGNDFKCEHSFAVTTIDEEKKNYLALYGYNEKEIEEEIKNSFLNFK